LGFPKPDVLEVKKEKTIRWTFPAGISVGLLAVGPWLYVAAMKAAAKIRETGKGD
jgi:hypothetical protein